MGTISKDKPRMVFQGPKRTVFGSENQSREAKPVFRTPSWIPGLGFHATAVDIWECEEQEFLSLKQLAVEDILHVKAALKAAMNFEHKPSMAQEKVKWFHLPANNVSLFGTFLTIGNKLTSFR
jgi:hypothetical protein